MASPGSPPNALRGREQARGAAGRYAFVAEIARGYLGTLWVARDPADHSATAFVRHVTPITSESTRTALLEAARGAIVAGAETLEVHEAKTGVDIVSPFEDGEVLRTLLRTAALRHAPPPPEVLIGIASEIAAQLHDVHTAGDGSLPVFGGLHADSVFIGADGGVRLLDAGAGVVASALEPWRSDPQRVGYFAPEQIEAKGTLDARTDVFVMGILLWEAFANRRLFPGNDARSTRERVLRAPIPRLDATQKSAAAGVATPIADVVAKALSRDSAERYGSMGELAEALTTRGPAGAGALGEWVKGLAGTVIEKRHNLLERGSTAQSPAHVAGALTQPAPEPPAASKPPAATAPPELPRTPPPAAAAPSELPRTPPPAAAAPPELPWTPPPPMPAPVVPATPKAPDAMITAWATTSKDAVTLPAPESTPPPASRPAVEAVAASPEPVVGPESTAPVVVTSAAPAPGVREPEQEPAEPPGEAEAEPASETRSRADSAEAIDVGDEDLAEPSEPPPAMTTPPPPPSMKRPPKLPDVSPAAGGHAEEDVLGGQHSASLASPVGVSQLGALTQKPAESRATWIIGAVAALLLGIGGIFLLKGRGAEAPPEKPGAAAFGEHEAPKAAAEAPKPVEPPPEPPASAAPEPPPAVAVPPVQVEASEPAPPPKAAAAPEKSPELAPEKPKSAAPREAAAPARPRTASETGQRRPPPTRSAPGSTYKPGGI